MAQVIALTALTTLELSCAPVHEPVHGQWPHAPLIQLLYVTSPRAAGRTFFICWAVTW